MRKVFIYILVDPRRPEDVRYAKRLGIGRQTLYNKIKLYQLQE